MIPDYIFVTVTNNIPPLLRVQGYKTLKCVDHWVYKVRLAHRNYNVDYMCEVLFQMHKKCKTIHSTFHII